MEFLVTAPDGSIVKRTLLGEKGQNDDGPTTSLPWSCLSRGLLITAEQVGTQEDQNAVYYFDLPLAPSVK